MWLYSNVKPVTADKKKTKKIIYSNLVYFSQTLHSFFPFLQDMLVSLSTLLRGTTHEKLRWTLTLYDLNGDGFITRQEVLNVMIAVHDLMGMHGTPYVSILFLYGENFLS